MVIFVLLKWSFIIIMLMTGQKKIMWSIWMKFCTRVGSKIGTQTKKSPKKILLRSAAGSINGVYSLKWRLTDRYLRWGTPATGPGRGQSVQIEWISVWTALLEFPALLSVPHLLAREMGLVQITSLSPISMDLRPADEEIFFKFFNFLRKEEKGKYEIIVQYKC